MTHMALTAEVSSSMSSSLLILILMCIYKHPIVEETFGELLESLFFTKDHLNSDYRPPMVQTSEELNMEASISMEPWKQKLDFEGPLLMKLRRGKSVVIFITWLLMKIGGFMEKVKNLLTWHDPTKTFWFLGSVIVIYILTAMTPFRFLSLMLGT